MNVDSKREGKEEVPGEVVVVAAVAVVVLLTVVMLMVVAVVLMMMLFPCFFSTVMFIIFIICVALVRSDLPGYHIPTRSKGRLRAHQSLPAP